MARGRKTGGRQKGTPNRRTAQMMEAARAGGEFPHEFLLRVSRGGIVDGHEVTFEERVAATAKAAPYFAPRLASAEVRSATLDVTRLSDEELEQLIQMYDRHALDWTDRDVDAVPAEPRRALDFRPGN